MTKACTLEQGSGSRLAPREGEGRRRRKRKNKAGLKYKQYPGGKRDDAESLRTQVG